MSQRFASAEVGGLLKRATAGDEAALGSLLDLYRRRLTSIAARQAMRRLQAKADASDLVQDTLLEAHRHIAEFRGATVAEFSAWLRRILDGVVANHARRYLGTKCRDARLERDLPREFGRASASAPPAIAADITSPSQQATDREAASRLARALDSLPAHYREVIVYRHIEGRPCAEVATRMGRTVESVEKIWVRALARLRTILGSGQD
ncbi:MAG TPA: sigma-70 family RNA polymerase sigma factor [Pirellulales bacterium]|nr:sigma-70 family RNA polymerase sigma factor [Pirellulales bacterium]